MGPEKVYTQKEVDELLIAQRDQIEARHFEERTEEVLHEINRRLDESNNYKSTIGKDVKEVKDRLMKIEDARAKEAEQVKKDLESRQETEDKKRVWWQDWWIRIGIGGTIIWELVNIYQAGGGSVHDIIHGIIGK